LSKKNTAVLRTLLFLCLIPFWVPPTYAISAIDAFHQDIIEENWAAADRLIPQLENDRTVDSYDLEFSIGMMSVARKDYPRAIKAFRKILATRPELIRVRLELARALFLNGDYETAKLHFERVLGSHVPAPVAANVMRYLTAIRQNRSWTLNVSIGYLADSNANNGTAQDIVHFFGIPFAVSDNAKKHSGNGMSLWAKGTYRFRLTPQLGIFTFTSIARRDYQNSQYDDMTVRVGAGPSWSNRALTVNLTPLVAYRTYGNKSYSHSAGVRLEVNKQLSNRWVADVNTEWLDTQNAISSIYDEKNIGANTYLYYSPSSTTTFRVGGAWQRIDSRTSYLGYDLMGASLGIFRDWTHGITTGLTWDYQHLSYKGIQPFFNQRRNDNINVFSLSIGKRDWAMAGFMPVVSLSRIQDSSSISFFSYTRTLIELRLDQRF
jgi:hypothetical protein